MKIAAIADPDTVIGLRLAGVKRSFSVETAEQAEQALRELSQDQTIGLIIITERLADKIRQAVSRLTSERTVPVIIEVPDKRGVERDRRDPLMDMIKRAVGIELKF